MRVRELIRLLERQDPDAIVVFNDRSEFMRTGLIRQATADDVQRIQLAAVSDEFGECLVPDDGKRKDARGGTPGLLLGPA